MSAVVEFKNTSLYYGRGRILKGVDLAFDKNKVTCVIGPSGSGKSTMLRTINRMNDLIPDFHFTGEVLFNNKDIYGKGVPVHRLRQDIGMVFQKPCIFPGSIHDNVLFGVRHLGSKKKSDFPFIVEETLKSVSLWKEVKEKLQRPALELSEGQQQRLSIARALAVNPKVLLMDEPTSSLDHKSSEAVEELVRRLKSSLTIIMVTHKLEQAKKVADDVVFICEGVVCESGRAEKFFKEPRESTTRSYINHDSYRETIC